MSCGECVESMRRVKAGILACIRHSLQEQPCAWGTQCHGSVGTGANGTEHQCSRGRATPWRYVVCWYNGTIGLLTSNAAKAAARGHVLVLGGMAAGG